MRIRGLPFQVGQKLRFDAGSAHVPVGAVGGQIMRSGAHGLKDSLAGARGLIVAAAVDGGICDFDQQGICQIDRAVVGAIGIIRTQQGLVDRHMLSANHAAVAHPHHVVRVVNQDVPRRHRAVAHENRGVTLMKLGVAQRVGRSRICGE